MVHFLYLKWGDELNYVPLHRLKYSLSMKKEDKAPVLKNVIYALKLVWKADKTLFFGYIFSQCVSIFFGLFIRSVLFLKVLLNVIEGNQDFSLYVKYLVMFLITSFVLIAVEWYAMYARSYSTKKVLKVLNNKLFQKAIELDVSCYEDPEFYDKYQRATSVISSNRYESLVWSLADILAAIISFSCIITAVTIIDPLYLLFLVPVLFIFAVQVAMSKLFYKRDIEMTKNNRIKAYVQRTVFLKEYSKDMRTSNIFNVFMKRFEYAISSNIKILKKYGVKTFAYGMLTVLLSEFLPLVCTYAYAGHQFAYEGTMTISSFSVVLSSINSIRQSIYWVASDFSNINEMSLYFQNLREFFEYQPKVVSGEKIAGEFESIEFKNVNFKYPSAKDYSLKDVSLKINKGETVAIVGINGAGKSTLVKLLLRFYDATEGEVFYNGINIKEYNLESLRNRFATVFQDYKNFAVSVFENVMCRECSEEDKKFAKEALEQSGVWDKISSLENGGDTLLTREFDDNGAGLSGGENQKVSTARLFARNFDVAVLDEPSSALDPIAEYKMYENLISATKNKTVVYISHRLSSAVLSDNIYVLSHGTVVESGTHSQLMANGGEYAQMFTLQSSSYREEDENEE